MSRIVAVNLALGALAAVLVGTLVYLESQDEPTPTTTTTTTSTTTTTVAPTTTVPPTTTSTTTTTTTSTTSTIPTTTLPPFPRGFIDVVVVNGSSVGERLDPMIATLREAGYVIVRGLVGAVQTAETKVYFLDETFRAAAEVLALDAGLTVDDIAPLADAPPIPGRATAQLVLYLGGT